MGAAQSVRLEKISDVLRHCCVIALRALRRFSVIAQVERVDREGGGETEAQTMPVPQGTKEAVQDQQRGPFRTILMIVKAHAGGVLH